MFLRQSCLGYMQHFVGRGFSRDIQPTNEKGLQPLK
jgi:hypothetical protein